MRFGIGEQRFDSLIGHLRQCLERFPDKRPGRNATSSIADIAMVAVWVFPSDNRIREMPDPADRALREFVSPQAGAADLIRGTAL